jgi:hypothetical protein
MKDSQHSSKDNDKFLNMMEVSFGQLMLSNAKQEHQICIILSNLLTTPFSFKVLISIIFSTDLFIYFLKSLY